MRECKRCGAYLYSETRPCRCREFLIIDEEGEEHKAFSVNAVGAALDYAQKSNENGDYYLMNETVVIEVDGSKFKIGAEPDIHYTATEEQKGA